MTQFKPMLAAPADLERLTFPLLASPKLDGVRATIVNGELRSRSLKPFANRYTQALFSRDDLTGLDGEFILGSFTAPDVYRRTNQALATIEGEPELTLWVFDDWSTSFPFSVRLGNAHVGALRARVQGLSVNSVQHTLIEDLQALEKYEAMCVQSGFEGLMLRSLDGPYKHGRSTAREGWLLKLKRFDDMECKVLGIEEEMHNANEATRNELGRTKRSSHKAGKVGKGTMGALIVRGLNGPFTDVEFNIGSGFTAADRARLDWVGKTVKCKYFSVGVKDKPRHPVFLGERLAEDQS